MRKPFLVAAVAVAVLLAGGCSGGSKPAALVTSDSPGAAATPAETRDPRVIDEAFVADYCAARRDLYQYRTSNWKESVRAGTQMSPAADKEVIQAWRQYEMRLRAIAPPPDLSKWRDEALSALAGLLVGAPSGLELEGKYHPPPFPDTARRLEPLAEALGCQLPFLLLMREKG